MQEHWRWATDPSSDLGLVLAAGPPLTLADLLPGGAAQRAGLRRSQRVLAINGQPCGEIPSGEASALFDYRIGDSSIVFPLSRYHWLVTRPSDPLKLAEVNIGISPRKMPRAGLEEFRRHWQELLNAEGWARGSKRPAAFISS